MLFYIFLFNRNTRKKNEDVRGIVFVYNKSLIISEAHNTSLREILFKRNLVL